MLIVPGRGSELRLAECGPARLRRHHRRDFAAGWSRGTLAASDTTGLAGSRKILLNRVPVLFLRLNLFSGSRRQWADLLAHIHDLLAELLNKPKLVNAAANGGGIRQRPGRWPGSLREHPRQNVDVRDE